jgi:hypothetical protein
MRAAATGLLRRRGKCVGKFRGINRMRAAVVFRRPQDYCSHNPYEINALRAELVFRDPPG